MLRQSVNRSEPRPTAGSTSLEIRLEGALTRDELRDRMREAGYALRRLPMPRHGLPRGFEVSWPDIAYDWLAYGWVPARAPRIAPTAAEISRLDEMLTLCHLLTRDQRVVIWARAMGWTWRRIEALDELEHDGKGRTERHLRNILGDAEARILNHLNGTPKRMVVKGFSDTAQLVTV